MAVSDSWIRPKENLSAVNRFWHTSQRCSIEYPVMSLLTWLSLFGYIFSLAMTQTVYGKPFMSVRWVMLAALAASSAADWIISGSRRGYRDRSNGHILIFYLLATLITVIYAENWIFSGLRWTSHAAMLLIFVVFLPQIMPPMQTRWALGIIKYAMAALVVVSWFRPLVDEIPDAGSLYQGAMGNANTMGHIAFITAVLFLHTLFTSNLPTARFFSAAMAAAAAYTVWQSGARSSMIALLAGVLLLFYFYRSEIKWFAMAGILLGGLAMISFPKLPDQVSAFVLKDQYGEAKTVLIPIKTRLPIWSAAYKGFKARPLVGWGFGADSSITKNWEVTLTALGVTKRDAVNDFLFMMEGSGITGLFAYLLLIYIVLRQRPSRNPISFLRSLRRNQEAHSSTIYLYHTHVVLFILPTCLLILNQFDNSALSAGNLISVTTWLSTGCAAILRNEMH